MFRCVLSEPICPGTPNSTSSWWSASPICTIAGRLLADYELESVWVKATKPEPPIPLTVDEVSVEVWREPEE